MIITYNLKYLKLLVAFMVVAAIILKLSLPVRHDSKHGKEQSHEEISNIEVSPYEELSPNYGFVPPFFKPGYKRDELYSGKIPPIIHQIWDTYNIPNRFEKWIRTWKAVNPTWQHWLWSLDDARKLIEDFYPKYLTLYDSYISNAFRADAARYFIIYHFGGVYFDLDMVSLRPLHNWTHEFDCIVSEEPYEHSFVVREQNNTDILNGFIACKEQHPLLEATLDGLMEASGPYFGDLLRATGPFFFTSVYNEWKENKGMKDGSKVLVLPPKYFFPTYDKSESDTLSTKCHPKNIQSLPPKGKIICRNLILRSFSNEVDRESYTDHYWLHSYMFGESFKTENTLNASHLVRGIILARTQV